MKKYLSFFIILLLLIPCLVFADIIYLKSGGEIEGVIEWETNYTVSVAVSIGSVTYSKAEIESISKSSSEENAKLKEKWKKEKERREAEQEEWQKFTKEQEAKGLIFYNGEWITKEEHEKLTKPIEPKKILTSSSNRYRDKLGKVSNLALKKDKSQSYYLYLPKDYNDDKKWPLFIGMHGYMGNGKQVVDLWRAYADPEGFILVCPTFPDGFQRLEYATDYKLIDIIKETRENFRIDKEKIILVGFSGGAQFAHRFALRHPEHVNSVVVLAAGSYDYPAYTSSAKHIKFLVGVGTNDSERLEITKKFAKQLQDNGYKVKFEIFPNVGHELPPAAKQLTIELFREMIK